MIGTQNKGTFPFEYSTVTPGTFVLYLSTYFSMLSQRTTRTSLKDVTKYFSVV
jgi:hypothetical protein